MLSIYPNDIDASGIKLAMLHLLSLL